MCRASSTTLRDDRSLHQVIELLILSKCFRINQIVGTAAFWIYKPARGAAFARLKQVLYANIILLHALRGAVISVALLRLCSRNVRTIASSFRMFLRLVSHGPFRVPPRWHLSVRVNQKKFYSHMSLSQFMRGQVRTVRGVHVRHWGHNVAAAEIIQFQRRQLTDVPVLH